MYATQNTRQINRQLDREEEVATDRCMQHRTINRDREIGRLRGGEGGSFRQVDVYNTEYQIDK